MVETGRSVYLSGWMMQPRRDLVMPLMMPLDQRTAGPGYDHWEEATEGSTWPLAYLCHTAGIALYHLTDSFRANVIRGSAHAYLEPSQRAGRCQSGD